MKNPFKSSETPTPPPTTDPTLLNQKLQAQSKEAHLTKRLSHLKPYQFNTREEFEETRDKLQKELNKVSRNRAILEHDCDVQAKRERATKTKALLQENIDRIAVEKSGAKLSINKETLTVTVPFTNCKHSKEFTLNDLIPFERQRIWEDIVNGMALTLHKNCEQCRKEKRSMLKKLRLYKNTPIGSATLTIRGMN